MPFSHFLGDLYHQQNGTIWGLGRITFLDELSHHVEENQNIPDPDALKLYRIHVLIKYIEHVYDTIPMRQSCGMFWFFPT